MRSRFFISIVLVPFLLIGCEKREVDFVPGSLYCVTTTEGDGFVLFEHLPDDQWRGVYYLSKGKLMAEKRIVELKIGKELALIDETGKDIPIISYCRYEEPEFKDYPETWAYRDTVFSVSVKKDVIYGNAQGYWTSYPDTEGTYQEIYNAKQQELEEGKKELELTMDVYLPNDNKNASRPLLVLIHGGAFFNGDKADLGLPEWSRDFASMGYVVASVNYRLGFKKNLASVKQAGFYAVQDIDAAIRYLVHNKDTFTIDPDRVFVAGTSAGGITALNVAFMRNENIPSEAQGEGDISVVNPEFKESYNIRAVGNMWGAVNDLSILGNSTSSVISFHNTGDPVVPFGKGHPFENVFLNWLFFPIMYGSEKITEYLGNQRAVLKPYNLSNMHTLHVTKDDNGREILNNLFYEIEICMRDYFSSVMLPSPVVVKHTDSMPSFQLLSTDLDTYNWRVEGGAILKQSDNSIDVLMFPDISEHSVIVCGKYKSGLTFKYKWNQ